MLRVYVDAATKGNPGPSGGGIVVTGMIETPPYMNSFIFHWEIVQIMKRNLKFS